VTLCCSGCYSRGPISNCVSLCTATSGHDKLLPWLRSPETAAVDGPNKDAI
jgi:hypothetical protein